MKKFFYVTLFIFSIIISNISSGQIYIAIDGVEGEAQLRDFPNSTQIQSFSWGGTNPVTIGPAWAGMSSGKVSLGEISFSKMRGQASAGIQSALYTGKKITKAEIRFYNPAQTTAYLTIILEDLFITNWKISGENSEKPTETVSITAVRVKTEEYFRNATGTPKRVATSWDNSKNATIPW